MIRVLTLNGITVYVMLEKMDDERRLCYDYDHTLNVLELNERHPYVRHAMKLSRGVLEASLLVTVPSFVAFHIAHCADCRERLDFEPDASYDVIYGELLRPVGEQDEEIARGG
jgi:hypothetical protein